MVGWCHQRNGHEFEHTLVMVMDTESWPAVFHGVTNSQTRLSN